jgi:hypothetical protein
VWEADVTALVGGILETMTATRSRFAFLEASWEVLLGVFCRMDGLEYGLDGMERSA